MNQNLARWDRVGRTVVATSMLVGAFAARIPWTVAVFALALPAVYMAFTALAGTCLGYRLMGYSTCPVR
jgi:hypothetical protein